MNRNCKPSGSRSDRRSDADDLVVQSQSLITLNVPSRHLICSHDDRFKDCLTGIPDLLQAFCEGDSRV